MEFSYLKSGNGMMQILEIIVSLIIFICSIIACSMIGSFGQGGWGAFVSFLGTSVTLGLFISCWKRASANVTKTQIGVPGIFGVSVKTSGKNSKGEPAKIKFGLGGEAGGGINVRLNRTLKFNDKYGDLTVGSVVEIVYYILWAFFYFTAGIALAVAADSQWGSQIRPAAATGSVFAFAAMIIFASDGFVKIKRICQAAAEKDNVSL